MVRLFHTLKEMDYLPVRQEVRERIAAMWGVTPAWQGAPEAFGGLSTQTQQLVVMSRVVEGDQRMFHDKVFPLLLEAFGVTDWTLELPTPEEKAEATRISFAQQRVAVASQLNQMGFTVKLKDQNMDLEELAFVVEGESVPMVQLQGEQTALGIEQTMQQMEQQKQQQEMMEQQQQQMAGGGEQPPAEGAEGEGMSTEEEDRLQAEASEGEDMEDTDLESDFDEEEEEE